MTMQWIAFLIVAVLVLSGSIVLGVLASREPPPPAARPEPVPDLDAHWSQTEDLFKPEEGKS